MRSCQWLLIDKISTIEFSDHLESIDVATIFTKQKIIAKRRRRFQAFNKMQYGRKQYICTYYIQVMS